jgi:ABC-type cobalamin/Fe3+-siderophores transport system ATPase subunit
MKPAVELRNVSVRHGNQTVLKEISLTINEGEFVTVVGPNGAGKTTLLKMINGLQETSAGLVNVMGCNVNHHNGHVVRKRIGYVPQIVSIDPRLPISVQEVVMMGRFGRMGVLRRPGGTDREVVDGVMELTGTGSLASRPIGHLSGGEQQKVAIARALAQQPELLLLDEPTANLDLAAQRDIAQLVGQIYAQEELTIVLVTHFIDRIPPSCSRAVLMKGGCLTKDGKPETVLTEENLSSLYQCPVKRVDAVSFVLG